jgi:hypothetical protein
MLVVVGAWSLWFNKADDPTDYLSIIVLGTVFRVREPGASSEASVSLYQGAVEVASGVATAELKRGERFTLRVCLNFVTEVIYASFRAIDLTFLQIGNTTTITNR